MKKQLRIFSWGYWGWGNCAEQFIQACDLVEQDRDFNPPVFVDVRLLKPTQYAKGFVKAQVSIFRGKLFLQLGDVTRAAEEFNRAVKNDHYNVHMLSCLMETEVNVARQLRDSGEVDAATTSANHAMELANRILRFDSSRQGALYAQEDLHHEFKIE